jgi:hypothetical protein
MQVFRETCVSDNCNTNTTSYTSNFETNHVNDSRLDGRTFVTGLANSRSEKLKCSNPPTKQLPLNFARPHLRNRMFRKFGDKSEPFSVIFGEGPMFV